MISTVAFDADDTLWHNEKIFISAKKRYKELLARYHDPEWIEDRLDATEMRNIKHFGYGIKGFTLSMIETAVELTEGRVKGNEIQEIIGFAHEMLSAPIELLPGVQHTVESLASDYSLMVITKGDLFDQETKLARSGLGDHFEHVEIVSEKHAGVYETVLERLSVAKDSFVMVGNSLKSDILPVLEIGARAVHVPYETEWVHERVEKERLSRFEIQSIERIDGLGNWLTEESSSAAR